MVSALYSGSLAPVLALLSLDPVPRTASHSSQLLQHFLSLQAIRALPTDLRSPCVLEFRMQHFPAGCTVYSMGQPADRYYVLLRGKMQAAMPQTKVKVQRKESLLQGKVVATLFRKRKERAQIRALPASVVPETVTEQVLVSREIALGESFGEEALKEGSKRLATVTCSEDCTVAYLSGSIYSQLVAEREETRIKDQVRLIREMPAFSKWTRKSLSLLVALMQEKTYTKGCVLYREGETADIVYFTLSGEYQFSKQVGLDEEAVKDFAGENLPAFRRGNRHMTPGRVSKVAVLTKADRQIFGHVEIMEDCKRLFTCTCVSRAGAALELSKVVRNTQDFLRRTQNQDTWSVLQRMGSEEKAWVERQMARLGQAEMEKCRIALAKPRTAVAGRRGSASPATGHRKVGSAVDLGTGDASMESDFRLASVKRTSSYFNDAEGSFSPSRRPPSSANSGFSPDSQHPRPRLAPRQVRRLSSML